MQYAKKQKGFKKWKNATSMQIRSSDIKKCPSELRRENPDGFVEIFNFMLQSPIIQSDKSTHSG